MNTDFYLSNGQKIWWNTGGQQISAASGGVNNQLTYLAPVDNKAAGVGLGHEFNWSVNQSGTAGYTGLQVNVTETAAGSGSKNLLDLKLGGTSRFAVDSVGSLQPRPAATTNAVINTGTGDQYLFAYNGTNRIRWGSGGTQVSMEGVSIKLNNGMGYTFNDGQAMKAYSPSPTRPELEFTAGTNVASNAVYPGFIFQQTINTTATGGYTLIQGNVTGTLAGSGAAKLLDLQVAGSSKLSVDASGNVAAGKVVASKAIIAGVVALTDDVTIATDAALGNTFTVTLTDNRTLGAPTNPVDGQRCVWRIRQDGVGSRTLALDPVFRLGIDVAAVTLTAAADKTDYLTAIYNAADATWDVISFVRGY
jgi:hypothetical protein